MVQRRVLPDFNPRWVLGGFGAALLAAGCVVTALARPSSLPLGGSWSTWWTSTLETASYTRLTFTNAGFNAIAVSEDETTIWALGDNGLALRSTDRGRSWTWIRIAPDGAAAPGIAGAPTVLNAAAANAAADQIIAQVVAQQSTAQAYAPQTSGPVPRYPFARNSASIPEDVFRSLDISIKEFASSSGPVYVTPFTAADEPNGLAVERGRQIAGLLAKMGLREDRIEILRPVVSTVPGVDVGLVRPAVALQSPVQATLPNAQIRLPPPQTQAPPPLAAQPSTAQPALAPNFAFGCFQSDGFMTAAAGGRVSSWRGGPAETTLSPPNDDLVENLFAAATVSAASCTFGAAGNHLVVTGEILPIAAPQIMQMSDVIDNATVSFFIDNATRQTTLAPVLEIPQALDLPAGDYLANSGFVDVKLRRWVVTSDARILNAELGRTAWGETALPGAPALNAIFFTNDDVRGWVVGDDGAIYRTRDSGASWSPIAQLADESALHAVVFLQDGETGWAAGDGGLYGSDDGGVTWSPVALLPENLSAWSDTGASFRLTDAGALERCAAGEAAGMCADAPTNVLLPAPLALVTFFFAFFTLTLAGFAPDKLVPEDETAERESVGSASAYASDRPLTQGDFDLLNLGGIARGLAEFLVNRRTEPPLSVAVDGPWGSGKSSLLNLLVGGEAARRRFRIVWFNAWHHEREENTLGAILEMICRDAIPAFVSPFGFAMRVKLLWSKICARPVAYLAGLSVVVFITAVSLTNPRIPAELLQPVWAFIAGAFGTETGDTANVEDIESLIPLGGGILAALYVLFNLQTKLFALAKTADGFLPRLIFTPGRKALMTDVGLRNRFAREFAAVTKAMRPMRLIIVIDDLDRCQPAKVVEILQLVNFLMTSGECFVIAAADLNFVEACVRQEYREVGGLLFTADDSEPGKDASERNLSEFAHRYLRKIINVVVRVPRMTAEQSKTFVNEDAIGELRTRRKRENHSPWSYAAWGLLTVIAVVGPLLLAEQVVSERALVQQQQPAPSAAPSVVSGPATATPGEAPVAPSIQPTEIPRPPLQVRTADASGPASWLWYLLPLAILAYFISVAWQIWQIVEATRKTDSKAFTEALTRWVPLVYEKTPTPRDIRRFTNQARYLTAQNGFSGGGALSDEQLVKFAVLEFVDRDWFDRLDNSAVTRMDNARTDEGRSLPKDWSENLTKAAYEAFSSAASLPSNQWRGSIEDYRKLASRSKWPEPKRNADATPK